MKLLDKLKNTFFEEEYVEVEEKEPKKEKQEEVAKKIEPKEIKKEEIKVTKVEETPEPEVEEKKIENYSERELARKDSKLPYFDEDDFVEVEEPKKEEPKKLYGESVDKLYSSINYSQTSNNKPYSAPSKEAFKPTPIISPIYGILDKNYRKEEVVDKKDKMPSSYVSRKNADLDSIRKKAYGGLDPLEEMHKTPDVEPEPKEEIEEDNLLYDMTSDNSKPMVDQVTIADAEEYFEDLGLEYNIDYKDNRYEKATGRRVNQHKEENNDTLEETDANLEDNLFDLIDSMYEDGEE
jgi:hypothetical protein